MRLDNFLMQMYIYIRDQKDVKLQTPENIEYISMWGKNIGA